MVQSSLASQARLDASYGFAFARLMLGLLALACSSESAGPATEAGNLVPGAGGLAPGGSGGTVTPIAGSPGVAGGAATVGRGGAVANGGSVALPPAGGAGASAGGVSAGAGGAGGAAATPQYRRDVILNTSASGADIASTLENYPVPIQLSAENFDFGQAKPDGTDVHFTSAAGEALPHEIELWDAANQRAALWVKTTVQGDDATQSIVMHWGNMSAEDTSDSAQVFSPEENWVAVWHLGDDAGTTPNGFLDATGVNPATGHNLGPGSAMAARMGFGTSLDHLQNQGVKVVENRKNFDLAENITFEIWGYVRSFGYDRGYESYMTKGDESWRYMRANRTRGTEICSDGQSPACVFSRTNVEFETWYHFAGVHEGRAVRLYVNGVREDDGNAGSDHGSFGDHAVTLGFSLHNGQEQRFMNVIIDEARVTSDSKTDDWIKLDYESLKEGSTFVSFGPVSQEPL